MTVMSPLAEQLPALVAGAGYGRREPVMVGVHRQGRVPAFAARGVTGAGEPLSPATLAYTASLSKQITAACAALLVRDGVLDMEAALARWVPGLPGFARERIFVPLGMTSTRYWPGPAPAPPGAAPLPAPHPAPLSLGDGGVWSTASDLLRWSQALNADELGISQLIQTPGTLDGGPPVGYAWGMGIRSHAGHRVYRHGGGWPGLRALLARVPDLNLSLVILALADDTERRVDLAARLLDLVTAESA
jgi:CubicO group peptidase (beta-lactamase class C family)